MSRSKKANTKSKRQSGQFWSRKDDAIQWFQREGFDPAEFVGLLNSEKDLDQARNELGQLNEYCKQEVQKVVHAHHKDFLEAGRNIQDVEVLVDELRNYVSGSVAVVGNLVDLPPLPKQVSSAAPLTVDSVQPQSTWDSIMAPQEELLQDLQVAVAEQDVTAARSLLSTGRDIIAIIDRDGAQLAPQVQGDGLPAWRYAFEGALATQKAILIEELQHKLLQTNSSTIERRQVAQNLGLLVGPSQAAQALLGCHSLQVRAAQQYLLKQHSAAGGDPDGVEYAGRLAQRTFLAIGAAAEDVRAVFPSAPDAGRSTSTATFSGEAALPPSQSDNRGQAAATSAVLPSVSALVVQWASDEARQCAALLCRHALTPFAATGVAIGALLCVGLALVFCVALESSHGLALRVTFMEEIWPLLEAIVRRHLSRLRDEASTTVSVDVTNGALQAMAGSGGAAVDGSAGGRNEPEGSAGLSRLHEETLSALFPRADVSAAPSPPAGLTCLPMLLPELRALAEGLAPLASRPAVAVLRRGVLSIFESVCEKAHVSLGRLVDSYSAGNKDASTQGALLAAYVVKAEKLLRQFAEADLQSALEPLAWICGPVAPPELLLPFMAPLGELLAKLPAPAAEPTPTEAQMSSGQRLLQQQSSGLLDRIRIELETQQDRRGREPDGLKTAAVTPAPHGHASDIVEPAVDEGALPGAAPKANVSTRATSALLLPKPALRSAQPADDGTAGHSATAQPSLDAGAHDDIGNRDIGRLEAVPGQTRRPPALPAAAAAVAVAGGSQVERNVLELADRVSSRRQPRLELDSGLTQKPPQDDNWAADVRTLRGQQLEEEALNSDSAGAARARSTQWTALGPGPSVSPSAATYAGAPTGDGCEDGGRAGVESRSTSRPRPRGRDHLTGKNAASAGTGGDAPMPPGEPPSQLETTTGQLRGSIGYAGARHRSQLSGQITGYGEKAEDSMCSGMPDANADRGPHVRSVKFRDVQSDAVESGSRGQSDGDAAGRHADTLEQPEVKVLRQPSVPVSGPDMRSGLSQNAKGRDEEMELPLGLPARGQRLKEHDLGESLAADNLNSTGLRSGARPRPSNTPPEFELADVPRTRPSRRAQPEQRDGEGPSISHKGTAEFALSKTGHSEGRSLGGLAAGVGADEGLVELGANSRAETVRAAAGRSERDVRPATGSAARNRNRFGVVLSDDEDVKPAAGTAARKANRFGTAPSDADDVKPAAGTAARKANRFGVVLSDDEDGPVLAPGLRTARAAAVTKDSAASAIVPAGRTAPGQLDGTRREALYGSEESGQLQRDRPASRQERDDVKAAALKPVLERRPPHVSRIADETLASQPPDPPKPSRIGRDASIVPFVRTAESSGKNGNSVLPSLKVSGEAREVTGRELAGGADADGGRQQKARERLAARMAAKMAAAEDLL